MITVFQDAASRGCGRAMHVLVCILFHPGWVFFDEPYHQPTMLRLRDNALASIQQAFTPGTTPNQQSGTPWALDELLGSRASASASPPAERGNGTQLWASKY
jgi:hypothetical protein